MNKNSLRRSLMAGTCLTVASGTAAFAGTIIEGQGGAPADFSNDFNNPTLLAPGTDTVIGQAGFLGAETWDTDYIEFTGVPGGTFILTGVLGEGTPNLFGNAYTDSSTFLGGNPFGFSPPVILAQGTVPLDGKIKVGVNAEEAGGFYTLSLQTTPGTATPEPSTLATTGLGLGAAAWAWRRRQKS